MLMPSAKVPHSQVTKRLTSFSASFAYTIPANPYTQETLRKIKKIAAVSGIQLKAHPYTFHRWISFIISRKNLYFLQG
jgi:hypothetical protein